MGNVEDKLHAANRYSNVTLSEQELAELAPFGSERAVAVGDVLYDAGDDEYDFFVVLEGEVEIVRRGLDDEAVVAQHTPGRFLGELNFLTGQRAYLTARVAKAGRMLAIDRPTLRRVMSTKPDVSDKIFRAFVSRRDLLPRR